MGDSFYLPQLPGILALMAAVGYAALKLGEHRTPAMLAAIGFGMILSGRLFYSIIANQVMDVIDADVETTMAMLDTAFNFYDAAAYGTLTAAVFAGRRQPKPDDGF